MRRLRCSAAIYALATFLLLVSCCWIGCPRTAGAEERARGLDPGSSWNDKTIDVAKLFDAVVETVGQKFFDVALMKQVDWQARAKAAPPVCSLGRNRRRCGSPDQRVALGAQDVTYRTLYPR
jgi:hypothetical protein